MSKKKLLKASVFLYPTIFLLTSCDSSGISDPISSAIENALPNLWVSLAQLGAFIVTVFIFFKFAYKPIKKKLNERNEHIKKNIDDSHKALMDAQELKEENDKKLKEAHIKANQIVDNAVNQASIEANKVKEEAVKEADKKLKDVDELLKQKEEYLERKAHNEIVSNALDASKEILGREFNYDDNKKIVDDFLDQLENKED